MRVTLLDLGVGNLHSLEKAFGRALPTANVSVTSEAKDATSTDLLVLPGVGGWGGVDLGDDRLRLRDALESGLACVGICLGMQLLFESSEEAPGPGIGFFSGPVTRLESARRPHMGWSRLRLAAAHAGGAWPDAVYYAHSYACRPSRAADVVATTEIEGDTFAAVVSKKRTIGCQFHPEKSSSGGIALLAELVKRAVGS